MEKLITDYQPVVDDLEAAANGFHLMDSVSEIASIKIGVDSIVKKFDMLKKVVLDHRTALDTLCSSAVSITFH